MEVAASVSTIVGLVWSYMAKKDLPPLPSEEGESL
jgi:hypothetical protein